MAFRGSQFWIEVPAGARAELCDKRLHSTCTEEHRGTRVGGGIPTTQSENKSIPGSSGSVPGKPQPHSLDYIHYDEAVGNSLQVTFHTECGDCLAVWDTL